MGIDYEKCNGCRLCIQECRFYSLDEAKNKVLFEDSDNMCMLCGYCIAVCPQDAIIYEDFGDVAFSFEGIENLDSIVPYDNLYKFLRGHRSIRHYKKQEVPTEILKKVVDLMQYAPTGSNLRFEKYAIVTDREKLNLLSDIVIDTVLNTLGMGAQYEESFKARKKDYENILFHDAPHVIFVSSMLDMQLADHNIGIIITYERLAARSLGLGTCWNGFINIASQHNKKIMKIVGVRGKRMGAFTIGYPNINFKRAPPRSRKPVKGLKLD